MARIEVELPDSLAEHRAHFEWFIRTMVQKLHVNRHKVFPTEGDRGAQLYQLLCDENDELLEAMVRGDQFGTCLEAVDVANFGWLIALWACSITKEKFVGYCKSSQA